MNIINPKLGLMSAAYCYLNLDPWISLKAWALAGIWLIYLKVMR